LTGWGRTAVIAAALSLATAVGLQFYQAAQNERLVKRLTKLPSQELDEAITFDLSAVNIGIFVRDKNAPRPGLEYKLEADARRERLRESYNFASSEVTVWTDAQRIENSRNAAVRSAQDFVGAWFVIGVPHDTFQLSQRDRASYRGDNNTENIKAMWSRVRPSWVLLELTDWGSLCISEGDMKREGQGMPPTYSVDLPGSMDELRKRLGDTSKCTVDYC